MNKKYKFDFELLNSFPEMCFIVSNEGAILDVNQPAVSKLKLNKKYLPKITFFDLIEESHHEKTLKFISNFFNSGKSDSIVSKLKAKNGALDVQFYFSQFSDRGDNSKYCFVLAKDITDEKKKDIDLLRFYRVAENTVNPLQITDITGKMIYVNKAFVHASGYTEGELLGKNPNVFSSGKHSKKFWNRMWNTINEGKVWVGEVENRRKSGDPFFTQILISPILDHDGKVTAFFGVHRDLTEKKLLEKQLVHTQKMESIGTLAAGVAHEVGNPLASISALVQVVQRSTNDEFVKEKLELVKNQVTRISKIIRDLVDFSRPSNYELQMTDINQNIQEAVEIIKVGAKAKSINFEMELNDSIPILPLVADQIQQVFVNILLNAVDIIIESPRGLEKDLIRVCSEVDEDQIIIEFYDNGRGIADENLAKVFEPFYTTKKEGKGTGLGLWVSYGIIKSFQGDLKVSSKLGEGTTFKITLPIHP
ncbi:MAG: hypothetical protein AUK34_07470 [Ignavibacteria bacterium CG2_30_36_16]|nr:MAG: hypothetical protein AUK34_07470 [Ignavibacteria bacterium CG2_30_36_16]